MIADEIGLVELQFREETLREKNEGASPIFDEAKKWLDIYFSGCNPHFSPPLHITGSPFQLLVWKFIQKIPFGSTISYGEVAKEIAQQRGIPKMSAQAVGGALGRNKIPIIIPCHRIIGANGNLTGYSGGIDKKVKLLKHEKILK